MCLYGTHARGFGVRELVHSDDLVALFGRQREYPMLPAQDVANRTELGGTTRPTSERMGNLGTDIYVYISHST